MGLSFSSPQSRQAGKLLHRITKKLEILAMVMVA